MAMERGARPASVCSKKTRGEAGVDDVFHQQNVFVLNGIVQILGDAHHAGGGAAEAGNRQEIDLHRDFDGAGQSGQEKDGAFQNAYQLQVAAAIFFADLRGHFADARRDLFFGEQDAFDHWRGHSQAVFEDQILKILLIEDLNIDVRINGAQQFDFAILPGHQSLLHGGQLDVEIEFGKIKIGREGFDHVAVLVPLQRETARLIFPLDAIEIQQVGEQSARWDGRRRRASGWRGRRGRCRGAPAEAGLKLELRFGGGREQPFFDQGARGDGGAEDLGHLAGIHVLRVQHDVEGFGLGAGAAEAGASKAMCFGVLFASSLRAAGRSRR